MSGKANTASFAKSEVVIYRVIRGSAEFREHDGTRRELGAGDVITAGKDAAELVGIGENTQILRLGLLGGLENLRSWTPDQRDAVDGLAAGIICRKEMRSLRMAGKPVGYLYS